MKSAMVVVMMMSVVPILYFILKDSRILDTMLNWLAGFLGGVPEHVIAQVMATGALDFWMPAGVVVAASLAKRLLGDRLGLALLERRLPGEVTVAVRTRFVYTSSVKNVTLSADERVLERARELARQRSTTLNQLFRDWLAELAAERPRGDRYEELMRSLSHARSGGRFTRDEMNAR